ncbi:MULTISPECIES: exonuclease domain-containing protein [unclassified Corynebacterium]|uniref:3'-5' exonuclease n=1 Tax=unclassified Corynebacterium TaxID=2624378 RepID=UPI00143E0B4E|nr:MULTISPECIES: exonuclease domain-containing protein [unclassified Corynebacterium]
MDVDKLKLLAVDIETTGLDAKRHQILSIAWVPIDGQRIELAGAGSVLIQPENMHDVGESALIHHITDEMLAGGIPEQEAMTMLLDALSGRAMVAHFSALEVSFINAACRRHFNADFDTRLVKVVDTFALERRHMERMGTYPRGEDLRLARVRRRYGLPDYRSHNALSDALACAELYLALKEQSKAGTLKALMN